MEFGSSADGCRSTPFRQTGGVAKYDPLFEKLCRLGDDEVTVTFDEMHDLVGGLPASPERHRAWWANETDGRHVQARAWLNAGPEVVEVDLDGRTVRFSAARW